MRIGIDLDGCVADFVNHLADFCEEKLGRELSRAFPSWAMWIDWEMTKEEWTEHFYEFIMDNQWMTAPLMDGALESLKRLKEDGHTIIICTARGVADRKDSVVRANLDTLFWLEVNGIPFDGIIFSFDKSVANVDFLLDDGVHNLEAVERRKAVCFDQPYNQKWTGNRVKSWDEFLRFIKLHEQDFERY